MSSLGNCLRKSLLVLLSFFAVFVFLFPAIPVMAETMPPVSSMNAGFTAVGPGQYRITGGAHDTTGNGVKTVLMGISKDGGATVWDEGVHARPGDDGLFMRTWYNTNFTGGVDVDWGSNINYSWGSDGPTCTMGFTPDTFSVRWEGLIISDYSEYYTFYAECDDGVRLWIDDVLLINDWSDVAGERTSSTFWLGKGVHKIQMDYYDNTGSATAKLRWSSPSVPKQIIPETKFAPSTAHGWWGMYCDGYDYACNCDSFMRLETAINFDWGDGWWGSPGSPDDNFITSDDWWSSMWFSSVYVTAGTYTFYTDTDDGCYLEVDGVRKIDQMASSAGSWSTTVTLTEGFHDIFMGHNEKDGGAKAVLSWSGPGFSKQVLPSGNAVLTNAWEYWSYVFQPTQDGVYTIYSMARDMDGNWQSASYPSVTITHDATPPGLTITAPADGAKISVASTTITGTTSDNLTGVSLVEVSINGGAWQAASGTTSWSYAWNSIPDDNYAISVRATDNQSNVTYSTINVRVDDTPPTTTITAPAAGDVFGGNSYNIRGTGFDNFSGITGVQVSTDGGGTWAAATDDSLGGENPWTSWSYAWTLPADGPYTVMSRATDDTANVQSPVESNAVTIDRSIPSSAIVSPAVGSPTITGPSYTITGTALAAGASPVANVAVSFDNWATSANATDTSGDGSWSTWEYVWSVPTEGTYYIMSRAESGTGVKEGIKAGNEARINFTDPTAAITFPTSDDPIVKDQSYTITGTAVDPGINPSGVSLVQVSWDGGANWHDAADTSGDGSWSTWSYTGSAYVPAVNMDSVTIQCRATDNIGRVGSATGDSVTCAVPHPIVNFVHVYHNGSMLVPPGELDPKSIFLKGVGLDINFIADVDWNGNPSGQVNFITSTGQVVTAAAPGNPASVQQKINVGDTSLFGDNGKLKAVAVCSNGVSSAENVCQMTVAPQPFLLPPWLPTEVLNYANAYDKLNYGLEFPGLKVAGGVKPGDVPDNIPGFGGKAMQSVAKINLIAKMQTHMGRLTVGGGFGAGAQGAQTGFEQVTEFDNPLGKHNTTNPLNKVTPKATSETSSTKKILSVAAMDVTGWGRISGIANYKTDSSRWLWGGQLTLGATASVSQTWPFYPWGIPMYFNLSLTGNVQADFALLDFNPTPHFEGDLLADIYLRGALGVGFDSVASAEGFLGGGATILFHYPNPCEIRDLSLYVKAGVKAKIWVFEKEIELYNGRWSLIGGAQPSSITLGRSLFAGGGYSLMSRDYINEPKSGLFSLRPMMVPVTAAESLPGMAEGVIQYDVFPNSDPDISSGSPDELLSVWLRDDTSRNAVNRTQAVCSSYDGASWTPPVALDDDATADFSSVVLAFSNASSLTGAVAAWQDCDHELAEPLTMFDMDAARAEMTAALDISAATFDPVSGTWSAPAAITSNGYLDMPPMVSGPAPDDVLMVWLANPANDTEGSADNPHQVFYSRYDGLAWSAPALAGVVGRQVIKTDLAYDGSTGVLVLAAETDGDSESAEDRELFYMAFDGGTWSALQQLTNDSAVLASTKAVGSDHKVYRCIKDHFSDAAAGYTVIGEDLNEYRCTSRHTSDAGLVIGSDLNEYRCSWDHTSTSDTEPGAGADYAGYWTPTGNTGAAQTWAVGIDYKSSNEPGVGAAFIDFWEATGQTGDAPTWAAGNVYESSGENEPGAGEGWDGYWEATGATGAVQTWSASTSYTDHKSLIDANPNVEFDRLGNLVLAWLDGHRIAYSTTLDVSGAQTVAEPGHSSGAGDFKMARSSAGRIAVIWPDASTDDASPGSNLFMSLYDPNPAMPSWGEYRQMSFSKDSERYLSVGFLGEDLMVVVYDRANMYESLQTFTTDTGATMDVPVPVAETTDLAFMSYTVGGDLAILGDGMFVEPGNPAPGTDADVYVIAANLGDIAVTDDITVSVYGSDPSAFLPGDPTGGGSIIGSATIAGGLASGQMDIVVIPWSVPAVVSGPITLYAVVDSAHSIYAGDEDKNRANDIYSRTGMMPDLAIDTASNTTDVNDLVSVSVSIINSGALDSQPTDFVARHGSETGTVVYTEPVPALAPGETHDIAFTWDASGLAEPHQSLYLVVDEDELLADFDRTNDDVLMAVELGKPNIALSIDSVNFGKTGVGVVKDVTVTITNNGNADLTLSPVTDPAAPFSIDTGYVSGMVLGQHSTHDVTVSYSPTGTGASSASVFITSDDPDTPSMLIRLSGECLLPTGTVQINGGDAYTINSAVSLALSANGYGSDIDQMQISNDGVFDTEPWVDYSVVSAWTLAGPDGENTVSVRYMDLLGNVSDPVTDTIWLDTVDPVSLIATPSPGEFMPPGDASYTVIGGSYDTDGSGVSLVEVSTDGGVNWNPATDVSGDGSWSAWTYNWTRPDDGVYTLRVRSIDMAGNVEVASPGIDVNVDTTGPTGAVTVNYGAGFTNSTSVTLTTPAFDVYSDVTDMCFSNNTSAGWSTWESYAPSASWTLAPGDGVKTVYAKYKDAQGNVSGVYSDFIALDNLLYSQVWTWGYNAYGQLGHDIGTESTDVPGIVSGLDDAVAVSGVHHTAVLKKDGTVWTWGANDSNQLGRPGDSSVPGEVPGITDAVALATGFSFNVVLMSDGTVWTWGDNSMGQLGTGGGLYVTDVPAQVPGLSGIVAVSAGAGHVAALDSEGRVWTWGLNYTQQLGRAGAEDIPGLVPGVEGIVAVAAGGYHTAALRSDGTVMRWGDDDLDYEGVPGDSTPPVVVPGLENVIAISAGEYHTLALDSEGTLWSWGQNIFGQLGRTGDGTLPGEVSGIDGVVSISCAATAHNLVVKSDGTVWSWGYNNNGQLGRSGDNTVPGEVTGVGGAASAFCGANHSIALKYDTSAPATAISSPAGGANINGSSVTVSGTAADDSSGVATVEVSTDGGTNWSAATGTTSWSYSWTLPADGVYTLKTRSADNAGNAETPGTGITVRVDNTDPASAITAPAPSAVLTGASYTVTGTAADALGSGVARVEVSINGGAWTAATGTTSWSYNWTLPADGVYTVRSRATDNAGNVETPGAGVSVTVDDNAPTSSITAPADSANLNGTGFTITGTADDGTGTGVTGVEVSTDGGGTWNAATGTTSWSYNWTLPADGVYNIRSRASDGASFTESPSAGITVRVDNTEPASAITAPAGGDVLTGADYTITGTSSDTSGSGISRVEVSINGGPWTAAAGTASWSYSWTLPADGAYVLRSRATDSTGNIETPGTGVTVTVDNNEPTSAITAPADGADLRGAGYSITGTADDGDGTGVTGVEVSTDGGSTWNAATGTTSWSYSWTLPADGTYDILSRASDGASFTESPSAGVAVDVDNTAPSSSIGDPADLAVLAGSGYTVTGSSSDNLTGVGGVVVSTDGGFSWSSATDTSGDGTWSSWSYAWSLPISDGGTYTLMSRSSDNAGNAETPGSISVTVDNTPPVSSVSFPADATTMGTGPSYAITGTATGGYGTGITLVEVSTDGGETWAAASGTTSWSYAWDNPADGVYDIMSRATDSADNVETPGIGVRCAVNHTAFETFWTRQTGTSGHDLAEAAACDGSGAVYAVGMAGSGLGGETGSGGDDLFVTKYDMYGNSVWTSLFGTAGQDAANCVAVDGSGGVYTAGYTKGELDGGVREGYMDAFVVKYDEFGNRLWTRQIGTNRNDVACAVAVDGLGNAYVAGYTEAGLLGNEPLGRKDAFIVKYDPSGLLLWSRLLGTDMHDAANSIVVGGDGVIYVAGQTKGDLGASRSGYEDMFAAAFGPDGGLLWVNQMGTAKDDIARGVALDANGGVYVCGSTRGALGAQSAGYEDVFVVKYASDGGFEWIRQTGTAMKDDALGISVDAAGGVYVSGKTKGDLGGEAGSGLYDLFVTKYATDGDMLWCRVIGSALDDEGCAVAADGYFDAYVAGCTKGSLDGVNAGRYDLFVMRLGAVSDHCNNGVMDADEQDVDCGGIDCAACGDHCGNGVMDADEDGVDCGGIDCAPCEEHCANGIMDADEEGVDCGGADCEPCVGDSVTITGIIYRNAVKKLIVRAKSDAEPGTVTLTAEGFGELTYRPAYRDYKGVFKPVDKPVSVTVTSTGGGLATQALD